MWKMEKKSKEKCMFVCASKEREEKQHSQHGQFKLFGLVWFVRQDPSQYLKVKHKVY